MSVAWCARAVAKAQKDLQFLVLDRDSFQAATQKSIDYAVMEKADNIWTARGDFGWDDVGSWSALERHFAPDSEGNVLVGEGAEQLGSRDNLVVANGRLTALLGVKDLIVVQAEGATLVCTRERAEDLKKLLAALHAKGRYEDLM